MKITVNFDSLDEFEQYFGEQDESSQLAFELHQKIDKLNSQLNEQLKVIEGKVENSYHAGDDDIGGKFHKDIKDIDELTDDYNEELYQKALAAYDDVIKRHGKWGEDYAKRSLHNLIKDFEIKKGLSDDMYKLIINDFETYGII